MEVKNLIIFILKSFKRIDIKIIDALKAFFYYNLIEKSII